MTDEAPILYEELAEDAILAAAMYNDDYIHGMRDILKSGAKDFYRVANGYIWSAILTVYERGQHVDVISVASELRTRGQLEAVGGSNRLFWLTNQIGGPIDANTYADIVLRLSVKRQIINAASDMARTAGSGELDTAQIIGRARTALDTVSLRLRTNASVIDGDDLMADVMDEFERWQTDPDSGRGLTCGIRSIDALIGGFQPGTVTGILAETSMGKSTLTAGWVRAFAQQGPGLYVPTEMPGKVAFHKMACDMAGVPFKQARAGGLPRQLAQRVYAAQAEIMSYASNIKTLDVASPQMETIEAQVLQMLAGGGCKWLVVDSGSKFAKSLKIAAAGDNLYKATTVASGFLQDMARLGLVVVATWQIGRNTKARGTAGTGKEPTLHDAKDSGAVEEDVDVLFGLYRHDYFVKRKMADPDSRYPEGTAKLLLLKDRAGCDGDEEVTLGFQGGKGFTDEGVQHVDMSEGNRR